MKNLKQNELENQIFQIKNSEVQIKEILADLEKKLSLRNISKEELSRIQNLDLTSDVSSFNRQFDPAYIANQFEEGISIPKFTNPKYSFIKGPLKTIITKLIQFYSLLDKKLSENRIRAFYLVLHELIRSRKKIQRLEKKLFELSNILNQIQVKQTVSKNTFEFSDYYKLFQEDLEFDFTPIHSALHNSKKILLIEPIHAQLPKEILSKGQELSILTSLLEKKESLLKFTNSIFVQENIIEFKNYSEFDAIIYSGNICSLRPEFIHLLFLNFQKNSNTHTKFLISFSNQANSEILPFSLNSISKIDSEKFRIYLNELSFLNIKFLEMKPLEYVFFTKP